MCFWWLDLSKDTACCFEQILQAAHYKTAAVWTLNSYFVDTLISSFRQVSIFPQWVVTLSKISMHFLKKYICLKK